MVGTTLFLLDRVDKLIGFDCYKLYCNFSTIFMCFRTTFPAFIYMDGSCNDDSDLPEELRKRYTLSRILGK